MQSKLLLLVLVLGVPMSYASQQPELEIVPEQRPLAQDKPLKRGNAITLKKTPPAQQGFWSRLWKACCSSQQQEDEEQEKCACAHDESYQASSVQDRKRPFDHLTTDEKQSMFIEAVEHGDMARLVECLEDHATTYLIPYWDISSFKENGMTELNKVANSLLVYRAKQGQQNQPDQNLDRLACIAVIRGDYQATKTFLKMGASIQALSDLEFVDIQVQRVCDQRRYAFVSCSPHRYTPLHYLVCCGSKPERVTFEEKTVFDPLIKELALIGADFHKPTPAGRVPYLEAHKRVQALINQGEKERELRMGSGPNR